MLWLQTWGNPVFDQIFKIITALGANSIYIIYIGWIYWCVDRKNGEKWAYLIISSAMLNGIIKLIFMAPRPFQVGKGIFAVDPSTATGYSFPSGHSQASATFGGFLAFENRSKRIKLIGILFFVLIGFSRLYLRVHWPVDVLVGWTLGLCFATIYHFLYDKNPLFFKSLALGLFALSALFFRDSDQIKLMGLFFSMSIGMWVNNAYLNLPIHRFKEGGKRKLLFGLLVVAGMMGVLKLILPESLNSLRYGAIGLTVSLLYPWIFTRLFSKLSLKENL